MTREVIDILRAVKKLNKHSECVISINISICNPPEVHMCIEGFVKNFESYDITFRDSGDYPTELSHYEEGVKFFALSDALYIKSVVSCE